MFDSTWCVFQSRKRIFSKSMNMGPTASFYVPFLSKVLERDENTSSFHFPNWIEYSWHSLIQNCACLVSRYQRHKIKIFLSKLTIIDTDRITETSGSSHLLLIVEMTSFQVKNATNQTFCWTLMQAASMSILLGVDSGYCPKIWNYRITEH